MRRGGTCLEEASARAEEARSRYDNNGTQTDGSQSFVARSISNTTSGSAFAVDWDGDGDKDVLLAAGTKVVVYENECGVAAPAPLSRPEEDTWMPPVSEVFDTGGPVLSPDGRRNSWYKGTLGAVIAIIFLIVFFLEPGPARESSARVEAAAALGARRGSGSTCARAGPCSQWFRRWWINLTDASC